jgi:predicted peptidase
VCGYGDPREVVEGIVGVPVWAFHGDDDRVVPVTQTTAMVSALRETWERTGRRGPEPRVTIYPGVNHNSWDEAYREEKLGEWMLSQRR